MSGGAAAGEVAGGGGAEGGVLEGAGALGFELDLEHGWGEGVEGEGGEEAGEAEDGVGGAGEPWEAIGGTVSEDHGGAVADEAGEVGVGEGFLGFGFHAGPQERAVEAGAGAADEMEGVRGAGLAERASRFEGVVPGDGAVAGFAQAGG